MFMEFTQFWHQLHCSRSYDKNNLTAFWYFFDWHRSDSGEIVFFHKFSVYSTSFHVALRCVSKIFRPGMGSNGAQRYYFVPEHHSSFVRVCQVLPAQIHPQPPVHWRDGREAESVQSSRETIQGELLWVHKYMMEWGWGLQLWLLINSFCEGRKMMLL